jgi:DNA-binding transcriptional MerR regulator
MRYFMTDLTSRSGLTSRTIRDYIRQGWLDPPDGHGLAATYSEEQLLTVVAIARMRAAKAGWEEIGKRLGAWSLKKLRAYVAQSDPPAPSPPPAPAAAPALEGGAVPRNLPPRHPEADTTTELDAPASAADTLRGGRAFVMANVLPGLAIIVDQDAPALVKRVAAEILDKYGVMGGRD